MPVVKVVVLKDLHQDLQCLVHFYLAIFIAFCRLWGCLGENKVGLVGFAGVEPRRIQISAGRV